MANGNGGHSATSDRARGWLRYLHRKAYTPDNWNKGGQPLEWWDGRSTPPMLNFCRFDLLDSSYALALMADKTPAWREVYAGILDQLVQRHTTYHSAIDWLTQIGHDPKRASYPDEYRGLIRPSTGATTTRPDGPPTASPGRRGR